MIDFDRAGRNLRALLTLAFTDREAEWRRTLDSSTNGALQSFTAIILSVPFVALSLVMSRRAALASEFSEELVYTSAPAAFVLTGEMIAWALIWAASLIFLMALARGLKAERNASQLIVAYNWAQLLGATLLAIPVTVFLLSASYELMLILQVVLLVFNLYILWRILRTLLPLDVGATIAVISGLILIEFAIFTVTNDILIAFAQVAFG